MNKRTKHIPLSIEDAFCKKTLLVSGVSGFLGKVWLSMFLQHVDEFEHLYLIVRSKGGQSARDRFVQMVHSSFAFEPWFENASFEKLQHIINQKITVLEGDLSKENFGLSAFQIQEIQKTLDIMVNISGLVDFRASLEDSYNVNVKGTLHAADFISSCDHAKLIHVSTCYVAGETEGAIVEKIEDETPRNLDFTPQKEMKWIEYAIEKTKETYFGKEKTQEMNNFLRQRNEQKGKTQNIKQFQRTLDQLRGKEIKQELVRIGSERAQSLGFPNTYTYTKALAEKILKNEYAHIDYSIVRPSIVESSAKYPFPGWNEGFNTSGPIVYLVKGWFRYFPAEEEHPFDVIPVDIVAKGLTIVTAAKLIDKAAPVYHISTSFLNPFTIGDACQLSSDYYENFYRSTGKTFLERYGRHRKTIATLRDHFFSSKNLLKIFSNLEKHCASVDELPQVIRNWLKPIRSKITLTKRKLEQAENLLSIFKPYTHDFVQIYISKNITKFQVKEKFWKYDLVDLQWKEYWMESQMPGLQKWCFPVIEGRNVPQMNPTKKFTTQVQDHSMEALV
ncbi:MAG: SDR family oxidoreductase [Bdellovibrionales bacterium]|nr:SDR family oxidoreductase [Bdellovibrionales bacterium]